MWNSPDVSVLCIYRLSDHAFNSIVAKSLATDAYHGRETEGSVVV